MASITDPDELNQGTEIVVDNLCTCRRGQSY